MNIVNMTVLVALSSMLIACNSEQLPAGTSVRVTPSKKSITIAAIDPSSPSFCFIGEETLYQDVPVLISVSDSQGTPIGKTEVGVYADYSGNTFSGPAVLQVFADKNGNGVVDADTELVSGSESGVYKTKTDRYAGTATVFVRMNLTCPYVGELYVYAGASSALVEFEVRHEGADTTGGDTSAGDTTGGETTGGDTTAGDTSAGDTTGGDTTGGDTTGGDTTGGDTTGGDTTGGDTAGGDTTGGDTTGGDTIGGATTGGATTGGNTTGGDTAG